MPYKTHSDLINNNRKNKRERRKDPAYVAAERARDYETAKRRRQSETTEQADERRRKQREASRRQYSVPANRERRKAKHLAWRSQPHVKRRLRLLSRCRDLGITLDEYMSIKARQGSQCGICRCELPDVLATDANRNAEHIDHCHETGTVRGILCGACNTALGALGDNADGLRRALAYLEGNADPDTF
jgi:hypothetical protein